MSATPQRPSSNTRAVTRNVTYISATVKGFTEPRPTPPWLVEQLKKRFGDIVGRKKRASQEASGEGASPPVVDLRDDLAAGDGPPAPV